MEMTFNVTIEDGILSATMDVPAQGATGIPMDKAEFEKETNTLHLAFSQAGIKYEGVIKDNTMEGVFTQGPNELPLTMKKIVKTKPGDNSLPSSEDELMKLAANEIGNFKYKVEDYFARPKASQFQFSPNGSYLSYREKDENLKNHVFVKNLSTGKTTKVIEEKEELVRGYGWANDNRLIYVMDKGGNEDYHLFAANVDGSNLAELTPFDGVKVNILSIL